MQATVVICTFNGAARVPLVLEALARQTAAAGSWEILVIDNASTDGTGEVAARIIRENLGGRGRVVREDRTGLVFARVRAAQEAAGEIICFLDDDNIPEPDYVSAAVSAFGEHARAGVIGGKVHPQWEVSPTPLAEAVAPFALAICDHGETAMQVRGKGGIVGAGLTVRTPLLREIYSHRGTTGVTGRQGGNCLSGEDLVISIMAKRLGWEIWYEPGWRIIHRLPASRMDRGYLLRLYDGIGRGQSAVRRLTDWKMRTPLAWLVGTRDFGRWLAGAIRGPAPELSVRHPGIAHDLHQLNQKLVLGRACQALTWPF